MQDCVRRFPALHLLICVGGVICSALEIIGGLRVRMMQLASFTFNFT
jgi:hypothetical protein